MQNKLNEILELCIEKSEARMFYTFYCDPTIPHIVIEHCYRRENNVVVMHKHESQGCNSALEYMQNE